jgi:hypothetical protein
MYHDFLAASGTGIRGGERRTMQLAVFEKLLALNRGLDQVISDLRELEDMKEFDKSSMSFFTHDAEQLRAGVNRYIAEMIVKDADSESVRLDAERPAPEEEEEQ